MHSEAKRSTGDQKPKGDCVEHALRSLVDLVAWDAAEQRWDPARLPDTALPSVVEFYADAAAQLESSAGDARRTEGRVEQMSARWFGICLGLAGVRSPSGHTDAVDLNYSKGLVSFDAGVDAGAGLYELTPSPRNLLAGLGQTLGMSLPPTWAEASETCKGLGMGEVRVGEEGGRWVIDCGEAGAALRVVVKEPALNQSPAQASFVAQAGFGETIGHCYTLRAAPAQHDSEGSGWRAAAAPVWAAAWASGSLTEVQRSLVPRIVGVVMLSAAVTPEQAVQAVLHAPLDQAEVRRRAIDICRQHGLPSFYEEWLWSGFDKGGYQVRHFAQQQQRRVVGGGAAPRGLGGGGRSRGSSLGGGRRF